MSFMLEVIHRRRRMGIWWVVRHLSQSYRGLSNSNNLTTADAEGDLGLRARLLSEGVGPARIVSFRFRYRQLDVAARR